MTKRTPSPGWQALLWMGGVFVLVQFTAGLVLDYGVPDVRNPLLRMHLHSIDSRRTPPEILCLGSSRTGCGIDDRLATRFLRVATNNADVQIFNAALPGADPVSWEPLVKELLAREVPPRLFVLEVIPESLSDRSASVHFHIDRQLTWTTLPGHLKAALATPNLGRLLVSRLLPLFAFRECIRAASVPDHEEERPGTATEVYGGIPWMEVVIGATATEPSQRVRSGLFLVDRELRDYAPQGPARAALERSLERCRAAGVPVLLLGVPLPGPHREKYTPAIEASFRDYVAELRTRFDAPYVDCRDALPDALFADPNHAAPEGRERFTRYLAEAILAPRWNALSR